MRKGHNNGWLKNDQGKLLGLNLGADYCAEHEWGIKGIKKDFGLTDNPTLFGIERRTIQAIPGDIRSWEGKVVKTLLLHECGTKKNPEAILVYQDRGAEDCISYLTNPKHSSELKLPKPYKGARDPESDFYTLSTAWDEGSFGAHVRGLDNVNNLKEIYQALLKKDLAIWLGGGGVFQNAGLVLGIVSRLPVTNLETMRAADEDSYKLTETSDKIGIHKLLKEKGKSWFSLSPRWAKDNANLSTTYPVVYWLNPMDQRANNFGWFTVEQLLEWAEDRGPIPVKSNVSR